MDMTFDKLGIMPAIVEGLNKQSISIATDIQEKVIPLALERRDIIGQSQTGSGKTLAYLLPIFQRIDTEKKDIQAIILAPTHELVMQIDKQIKLLAENSGLFVKSAVIIGEVNINRQIEKLKEKPHIIVGSIGRIVELVKMKRITAHTVRTIVIDEADRLLDNDHYGKTKELIKAVMRDTQIMAFSAMVNEKTTLAAKDIMKNAEIVKIEDKELINPNITHMYLLSEQRDKIEMLRKLWASLKPSCAICFINASDEVEITTAKLRFHNIEACGIYGDMPKEERQKAMEGFRKGEYKLMIATDLAARGLDVTDVTHIFNLDLPRDSKEYLHRAGRTGRFGRPGTVVSVITKREEEQIKAFEKNFRIRINIKEIYMGRIVELGKGKTASRTISGKAVTKKKTANKSKLQKRK
ncbi:MAG: DEAD/DEAH box helicase [Bacillota bacterium]